MSIAFTREVLPELTFKQPIEYGVGYTEEALSLVESLAEEFGAGSELVMSIMVCIFLERQDVDETLDTLDDYYPNHFNGDDFAIQDFYIALTEVAEADLIVVCDDLAIHEDQAITYALAACLDDEDAMIDVRNYLDKFQDTF
ncbi:MAG: hypothetical protein RBJ76_13270 [Stenomitos frigidus ULC029]